MTAREMLLIVRAQNQASGALRRVAGDLRGLGQLQGLKMQGQKLQLARDSLMRQRQLAASELESINTGKRALTIKKAQHAAEMATLQANLRQSGVQKAMTQNQADQLRNAAQQSELQRKVASPRISDVRRNELAMRLEAAQLAAKNLALEEGRLGSKMQVANTAIAKQQVALRELEAREAEAARRADYLRSRMAGLGQSLAINSAAIEDNGRAITRAKWDRVSTLGRVMQHTSRIMEYGGLILGGSLALMAHQAAQFETSVTLAATQTRKAGQSFTATAANSKVLQKDIRGLMTQFPAAADDISKAAYDIFSSTDVNFRGGRKALKLFAQAAVAGQTDVKTATDAGIVVLNNFGNNVEKLPSRLQRMFAAVRFGRMTFTDFATSMSTIGPAARAANQSFDEMAGTFAFLTRHLDVAKSRVGFARVLEALASPKMLAGLHDVGIEIQDVNHHLLPLHEIVGKILTRFPKLAKGGTDAMNFFKNIGGNQGTIQARRAFTFMLQFFDKAGKDGASYLDMLHKVKNDNNEFTQSLAAMEKTTGVRWGVFINQLKALALEIGSAVVPALISMEGPLQRLIHWWQNLDSGTKSAVARFATYTAVFLLVGGAIMFVAGSVVRLFSFFGRLMGVMVGFGATAAAVAVTLGILTGHISSVSDAVSYLVDLGTGSTWGWIVMLGVGAAAALKLATAMKEVRTAMVATAAGEAAMGGGAAAGAGGGLIARLFGGARGLRTGLSLTREAMKARGVIAGLMAGMSLIPVSFGIAAAGMAAIAAGALLWKKHTADVQRIQEAINTSMERTKALAAVPTTTAKQFGGILGPFENIERANIQIRTTKREIADLQRQLAAAPVSQRAGLRDQIRGLQLDLYDLQKSVDTNLTRVNRDFDSFTASFNAQGRNLKAEADRNLRLDGLKNLRRMMENLGPGFRRSGVWTQAIKDLAQSIHFNLNSGLQGVNRQINLTKAGLDTLTQSGQRGAERLRSSFNQVVVGLSKMGKLPRVSQNALRDMFNVALQKGRMLTLPEMKLLLKAEVDKNSLRRLPATLRNQMKQAIHVRIDENKWNAASKRVAGSLAKAIGLKKVDVRPDTSKATAAFNKLKTPIHKKVIVDPPPNLAGIGASISAGIQGGMKKVTQRVVIEKIIRPIEQGVGKGSPARKLIPTGVSIMQGIIVGILSQRGELEKTAVITAEIFGGTVLSKLDEKKKVTPALLTKDLQAQLAQYRKFNNALARLARRGVPKELLDQLAALGPEAADKIAMLSRMSAPELRRYVALWKQAQAQIKRSQRTTQEEIKAAQKEFIANMVEQVRNLYDQIYSQISDQFGEIFSNIDPSLYGEGLKAAQEEYASSVADFQQQISDLNQQMVDLAKEKRDQLAQAFGPLFSGDWLTGEEVQTKLDWGQKLGMTDLMKDLQSQLDKFNNWRRNLTQLAKKVPVDLARALAALGPEAADKIAILNSASASELAQYVDLWKQSQGAITQAAQSNVFDTAEIVARMNDIATQLAAVVQKLGELKPPDSLTGGDIIKGVNDQIAKWQEYQATLDALIALGLPEEFVAQLAAMGPAALPFLQAITKMTKDQLAVLVAGWEKSHQLIEDATISTLNRQLQLWFKYGANIATQIVNGMSTQSAALSDYFEQLIMALLGNQRIPVPPGNEIPAGSGKDGKGGDTGSGKTGSGSGTNKSQMLSPAASARTTYNYNQTVNAVADESLSSTLAKASFRFKTTVPG